MPTETMNEIHAPGSDEMSAELSPRQPDDAARDVGIAYGSAATPVSAAAPPKLKKKRAPRPTFEDGALTRVFKFPSKKYPKSSYYVTDTEIIIRIRKARKKWKLILPKKRVVSCRTNRWFTKPRWIEVELTYTQAVRQGLHEPTAQPVRQESPEISATDPLSAIPVDLAAEVGSAVVPVSEAPAGIEAVDIETTGIEAENAVELDADNEADAELGADEVTGWVPDDDLDPSADEDAADTDTDTDDDFHAEVPIDDPGALVSFEGDTSADEAEDDDLTVVVEPAAAPTVHIEAGAASARPPADDVTVMTPEAAFEAPAEIALASIFDRPIVVPVGASIDVPVSPASEVLPLEAGEAIDPPAAVAPQVRDVTPTPEPIPFLVRTSRKRRYAEARLLAATLALAILSMSANWSHIADSTADNGSCARSLHATCENHAIVTGSIDVAAAPRAAEPEGPVEKNSDTEIVEQAISAELEPQAPAPAETPSVTSRPTPPTPIAQAPTQEPAREDVVVAMRLDPVVIPMAAASPPAPSPPEPAVVPIEAQSPPPTARSVEIERCPVRASALAKSTIVQFGFASAALPLLGVAPLEELASTLRQCPAVHVMIEGHTDSDGDYYRNQSLSVRRAEAVRQHLVNAGVGLSQLSIIGFGQIRPLAPNDSATNKSRNRRIELVVQ